MLRVAGSGTFRDSQLWSGPSEKAAVPGRTLWTFSKAGVPVNRMVAYRLVQGNQNKEAAGPHL